MKPNVIPRVLVSLFVFSVSVGWHNLMDTSWLAGTAAVLTGRAVRSFWR